MNKPTATDNFSDDQLPQPGTIEGSSRTLQPALQIPVADEQSTLTVDISRLQDAVSSVLSQSDYHSGSISIAVVDDPTIHSLNRRYLAHDWPTDVLSFTLVDAPPHLEGELVVSADTAVRSAGEVGWPADSELLLYVIHGSLHLVGFDDQSDHDCAEMRRAELEHLLKLDVELPTDRSRWATANGTPGLFGENHVK